MEAPPLPYKIQPKDVGKLLWITGAPGVGKSTTAQLLAKTAGYVYYEADCFTCCKNPYVPLDAEEPSIADLFQKCLVGEGLEERREVCKETQEEFGKLIGGKKQFEKEVGRRFNELLCANIEKERKRIGGDWVIAGVATATITREFRDIIRSNVLFQYHH